MRIALALLVTVTASLASASSPARGGADRFGVRRWQGATGPVLVAAHRSLIAVRYPAPAPWSGARSAADTGVAVQALLDKLDAGVAVERAWTIQRHGTVAVQLSGALDRAALARLAALVATDGGHLWPVLRRGPGVAGVTDLDDLLDTGPVEGRAFADDHLLVTARAGRLDDVLGIVLDKVDGVVVRRSRWLPDTAVVAVGAAVAFDAVEAAAVLSDMTVPDLVTAEPNLYRELRPRGSAPDPLLGHQWHLSRAQEPAASVPGEGTIHADVAWATTRGAASVVAAVFDSGCDWQHPDLLPNVRQDLMFDASEDGDTDPSPECQAAQDGIAEVPSCPSASPFVESHGTSVAGTIAARGENGLGVSGVCPECSLAPVRLLGEATNDALSIAESFDRACDPQNDGSGNGAWLINNSWGPGFSLYFPLSSAERAAFETCRTVGRQGKGTVILFAAGNETSNVRKDAYAKHPSVLSIAASTNLDDWASYSNFGNEIDVAAPSLGGTVEEDNFGIVTTDVRGGDRGYSIDGTNVDGSDIDVDYTDSFSGTSAASPVAAGVVGLVLSVNPDLTAEQVRLVLTRTADKILADKVPWEDFFGQDLAEIFAYDETGHSIGFGYGRVNAAAAVALAGDPVALGTVGMACTDGNGNANCALCDELLDRCLDPCTTQDDCVDGTVCNVERGACELPVERPGDFLAPCSADCVACVPTLDTEFLPTTVCSKECDVDADCDPACAGEDPATCPVDGFDCRPSTDDPDGPRVCAIADPSAGGPADFGACFNGQLGTSIVVLSDAGRELCGDICFDPTTDTPAACAYGFHCAEVTCVCTRESNFGCREFTCQQTSPGNGDFFFPVCVPDPGHADVCESDADCQFGDYCSPDGTCRFDDRQGCDVCKPCVDSSECGGRGVCLGTLDAQGNEQPGFCTTACDDGEACPGDSVCTTVGTFQPGFNGVRLRAFQVCAAPTETIACIDDSDCADGQACLDDGTCTHALFDACFGFDCTVGCRDDVPCADGRVCDDGVCLERDDGTPGEDDEGLTLAGGGPHCNSSDDGPAVLGVALLALLDRRRRLRSRSARRM